MGSIIKFVSVVGPEKRKTSTPKDLEKLIVRVLVEQDGIWNFEV
jgi:hypothetical protein